MAELWDCPDLITHLVSRRIAVARDFAHLWSYTSEYGFDAHLLKGRTYERYYLLIDDYHEPSADGIILIEADSDSEAKRKAEEWVRRYEQEVKPY